MAMSLRQYGGDTKSEQRFVSSMVERHSKWFTVNYSDLSGSMKTIGKGAQGTVFIADYKGTKVAVKRIYADFTKTQQRNVKREVKINRKLPNHPNVLKTIGLAHKDKKELYVVSEFIEGGSLYQNIMLKAQFRAMDVLNILRSVAKGIEHCHLNKVLHRDIKLDNILVSSDFQQVKLCDFGLAYRIKEGDNYESEMKRNKDGKKVVIHNSRYSICGTSGYMAPEVEKEQKYSYPIDIYSFGVLACCICTLQTAPPKVRKSDDFLFPTSIKEEYSNSLKLMFNETGVKVLLQCLELDPSKRPTASELVAQLEQTQICIDESTILKCDKRRSITVKLKGLFG